MPAVVTALLNRHDPLRLCRNSPGASCAGVFARGIGRPQRRAFPRTVAKEERGPRSGIERAFEMANVVVVGAQWGDEGKGKIVDWLSVDADVVVRYQGGHNAGHTLVIDTASISSPAALRHRAAGQALVIGNGVVVDPRQLVKEIASLREKGVAVSPTTAHRRKCAPDPAAPPRARRAARRTPPRCEQDRHHRARHRAGL